jgi:hypothetical protein
MRNLLLALCLALCTSAAAVESVTATAGTRIHVTWECPAPGCATADLAGFKLALYAKSPGGSWQKRVGVNLPQPAARSYTSPPLSAWLDAGDQFRVFVASVDTARNQSAPASSPIGVWQ